MSTVVSLSMREGFVVISGPRWKVVQLLYQWWVIYVQDAVHLRLPSEDGLKVEFLNDGDMWDGLRHIPLLYIGVGVTRVRFKIINISQ